MEVSGTFQPQIVKVLKPIEIPVQLESIIVSKSAEKNKQNKIIRNRWLGLCLTLLSGFLFACVGLIVKYLKGYHVLNIGFFRFLGVFLPALPCAFVEHWKHENGIFQPLWPPTEAQKLKTILALFGRALSGFLAIICQFIAIQHIPVADAIVISSCSSVFVGLAAHVFLKEKCKMFPFFMALITIAGVAIIARPPFLTGEEQYDWNTLVGTGFALSRMVLTSLKIIFVRYLRGVNASLVVVSTGFLQLLQCIVIALIMGVLKMPNNLSDLGLLVLLGIFSYFSQMAVTWALKCEKAGPYAVVRTSADTISAFVLQFIFLSVVPDIYSGLGSFILISIMLATIFKKWISSLPEENVWRRKFFFVLL